MPLDPSVYSQEIADRICAELAGGKSLRKICEQDDMPCRVTVFKWRREHEDFANQYVRAREDQADHYADEIAEIADDGRNDYIDTENGPAFNAEHVQRSKLRVDARKWIAAKLKPKIYGERQTIEHQLDDGIAERMKAARERASQET